MLLFTSQNARARARVQVTASAAGAEDELHRRGGAVAATVREVLTH